jgi:replication-associated recombination protein RarA
LGGDVRLTEKYRPKTLDEVYGQDKVTSFFKSVIRHIDNAPRYFLISGAFGTGKTCVVRSFAHDLLGTSAAPYYLEVDSGEKSLQSNFESLRNLIFQEVGGFKVVVLDEGHLIAPKVQEQLLKVVEDYYGPLVLFFATTAPHLLLDTLRSRLHHFSLSTFTADQLKDYALGILEKEGKAVSDRALSLAALNAQGHMRNMVQQLELILFQGEEEYLESYSSVFRGIESYFTNFSLGDKESVDALLRFHPAELRALMMYFFREDIINPQGRFKDIVPRHLVPKYFANFMRLIGLVREEDDYFSAILIFRQSLRAAIGGM